MSAESTTQQNESAAETLQQLKLRKTHVQERLKTLKITGLGWILSSLIGAAIICSLYLLTSISRNTEFNYYKLIPLLIVGLLTGTFMYGYVMFALRLTLSSRLRRIEYDLLQFGSDELQENIEENFFTKLVQINFKYIDQYYLQTQEQADKSFRLAASAAIAGLGIIIMGIIMIFFNKTEPAYVTTAAGTLSEFIAAVFFYLYNQTILKMSQYHQKLVIIQNISLALKITDEMSAELKAKSLELLIDRLTFDVNKHLTEVTS